MRAEFTAVYRKVSQGYVGYVEELPGANTQGATLLASVVALWVGRTTRSAVLEGAVVGLVAAVGGLWLAWPPDARAAAFLVGTTVAGIIGALAAERRPA